MSDLQPQLRVRCSSDGCEQWGDLVPEESGWWGSSEGDPDDANENLHATSISLDKAYELPAGWTISQTTRLPTCPSHSRGQLT